MNMLKRDREIERTTIPEGRRTPTNASQGRGVNGAKPNLPPRTWVVFVVILLLNYIAVSYLFPAADAPITIPYTVFKEQVTQGNIEAIYSQGESIEGRFRTAVTYPPAQAGEAASGREAQTPATVRGEPRTAITFTTTLPSFVDSGLEALLINNGVEISAEPIDSSDSPLLTLLYGFGPAILIIAFYIWMMMRAGQQSLVV